MHSKIKRLGLSENAHPSYAISSASSSIIKRIRAQCVESASRFSKEQALAHQHKHKATAEKLS